MYKVLSIGDTSQNIFLEMDPENAHLHTFRQETQEICFTYADKIPVKAMQETIGGNSANAAVSTARLGLSTALYTHVGLGAQGEHIIAELQRNNVVTDYVKVDQDKRSNYSTVINLNAERTILIYHEHRHYVMPKAETAEWVYLSSMGEGSDTIFADIVAYVQEHKAKLLYQPGTFQLKMGSEKAADLLRNTTIFAVNKEEAELYLGKPAGTSFRELLDGVRALGPEIALITDGPAGAYASNGLEYWYLGIIEEAPRIEATGAGDSFTSAFMVATAEGKSLPDALRWGQAQASSVIQKVGPQPGLLKREDLEKILADHPELQAEPLKS